MVHTIHPETNLNDVLTSSENEHYTSRKCSVLSSDQILENFRSQSLKGVRNSVISMSPIPKRRTSMAQSPTEDLSVYEVESEEEADNSIVEQTNEITQKSPEERLVVHETDYQSAEEESTQCQEDQDEDDTQLEVTEKNEEVQEEDTQFVRTEQYEVDVIENGNKKMSMLLEEDEEEEPEEESYVEISTLQISDRTFTTSTLCNSKTEDVVFRNATANRTESMIFSIPTFPNPNDSNFVCSTPRQFEDLSDESTCTAQVTNFCEVEATFEVSGRPRRKCAPVNLKEISLNEKLRNENEFKPRPRKYKKKVAKK